MPVYKRGDVYYYRFSVSGKRYAGSTGCSLKTDAVQWERRHRQAIASSHSSAELVHRATRELSRSEGVAIKDAWRLFQSKPRRPMSAKRASATLHRWQDFVGWLADHHPAVRRLEQITQDMAEAYVSDVRAREIAPATMNDYQQTPGLILNTLARDAGLAVKPFDHIEALDRHSVRREPYTPDEVARMLEMATGWRRQLLICGLYTGLRKGDILGLRWRDVDMVGRRIVRKLNKTGETVRVPIAQPLLDLFESIRPAGGCRPDALVFPDLAGLSVDYVTRGWKRWLKGQVGIKSRKMIDGRAQASSLKDIHSLRHTFVTECGARGIPLPVVQGWVGHMSEGMTRHYTHAVESAEHARLMLQLDYAGPADAGRLAGQAGEPDLQALADQIASLTPLQQKILRKLLGWPHPLQ